MSDEAAAHHQKAAEHLEKAVTHHKLAAGATPRRITTQHSTRSRCANPSRRRPQLSPHSAAGHRCHLSPRLAAAVGPGMVGPGVA